MANSTAIPVRRAADVRGRLEGRQGRSFSCSILSHDGCNRCAILASALCSLWEQNTLCRALDLAKDDFHFEVDSRRDALSVPQIAALHGAWRIVDDGNEPASLLVIYCGGYFTSIGSLDVIGALTMSKLQPGMRCLTRGLDELFDEPDFYLRALTGSLEETHSQAALAMVGGATRMLTESILYSVDRWHRQVPQGTRRCVIITGEGWGTVQSELNMSLCSTYLCCTGTTIGFVKDAAFFGAYCAFLQRNMNRV